jgi:hypothetical protein
VISLDLFEVKGIVIENELVDIFFSCLMQVEIMSMEEGIWRSRRSFEKDCKERRTLWNILDFRSFNFLGFLLDLLFFFGGLLPGSIKCRVSLPLGICCLWRVSICGVH